MTMRWQTALFMRSKALYSNDKSGRSCQCDQSPVVSQEYRHLYHCELMVDYVQKHIWYGPITLNWCWASRSSARWMAEHRTGKHTAIDSQHQSWTLRHRWSIQVMLTMKKQLNKFSEFALFVCEICIALGALFLWAGRCEKNYAER